MEGDFEWSQVWDFATALLIGALVGVEREKRKASEGDQGIGGLRTFILFALVGAISGRLATTLSMPWLVMVALVVVSAPVLAGYVLSARRQQADVGLTTEIAAIAVCLLGAMTTLGHRELAVALAVITASVLAYKQPLHGLVEKIGWEDVFAGLRLLIGTFIVLPLLPNRTIDPWNAINPYSLWLLVLVIATLSLIGYITTRWLGPNRGAALTGISGGLVSSTAVTLTFSRQSRDDIRQTTGYTMASGILLSWCVMFVRVLAALLVVNATLLRDLTVPFLLMAGVAGFIGWLFYRRGLTISVRDATTAQEVPLQNPFSLTSAMKFAGLIAVVLVLVNVVQQHFPGGGVYVVAALAGLTDVDAITLSMAQFAKDGSAHVAAIAIVVSAMANTFTKLAIVIAIGSKTLRLTIFGATLAILAAGTTGALLI